MTVRHHQRKERLVPSYMCQREGIERGQRFCQQVPGITLDEAVGTLLVDAVTPLALEVALSIQEELATRAEEIDRIRRQQVERARYEADLAQHRYVRVDPDNRLVADSLEADWNHKLRGLVAAQGEYDHQRKADARLLNEQQWAQILALATDFPRLWRSADTSDQQRKRMVRLLIEDVTLRKEREITAHIRFRGGATRTLTLPIPPQFWEMWLTTPEVVREIDRLLNHHTESEITGVLNEKGLRSGRGDVFTARLVAGIRRRYALEDRFTRLRRAGLLTATEVADLLGICPDTAKRWRRTGLLACQAYNDRSWLYEPPTDTTLVKWAHKLSRPASSKPVSSGPKKVQCGA